MELPRLDRRLHELFSVALAVLRAPDPDEALAGLVGALVREMGFRAAIVRLLDVESQTLRFVAGEGLSEAYVKKGAIDLARSSLDERVMRGEAVEIDDVTTDPAFQYGARARDEGLRSVLAVPIVIHDEPRGVLRAYTGARHHFTDEERGVLSAVARLAGEAFEQARRRKAIELIERDISSTLDLREVLDRLLRQTIEGLRFAAAAIRLYDEEDGVLLPAAARGLSRRYLRAGERRADNALDRRVLTGEVVAIHDLAREGGLAYPQAALDEGIRAVLSVPLVCRGRAIGILRLYSKRVRTFDDAEVRFLRVVAELGALAIENARLHRLLSERLEELGAQTSGWYQFLTIS